MDATEGTAGSPDGRAGARTAGPPSERAASREPIHSLAPSCERWPEELATIDAPPERLWARGRVELLDPGRVRVAIVGTRSPSPYGVSMARLFATELAARGAIIVSGLARGIDQAAHAAALAIGADSIAVLGTGVDRPWPTCPEAERLPLEGLLVSELRPGTPPRRHHFPLRNRLISGLSRGVLVVEAARASGSLITARWAADQGRMVWALPGRVDHPMSAGCHRLLREGALFAEAPEDLARELGLDGPGAASARARGAPGLPLRGHGAGGGGADQRLPALEQALLQALRGETLDADTLSRRLGAGLPEALTSLVGLELAGLVVRGPGGLYRLDPTRVG